MSSYIKKLNTDHRAHLIKTRDQKHFLVATTKTNVENTVRMFEINYTSNDKFKIKDKNGLVAGSLKDDRAARMLHNEVCKNLEKYIS